MRRAFVASVLVLGLVACGDDGNGGGGGGNPPGPVPLEQLPTEIARTYCNAIKQCGGAAFAEIAFGSDCVGRLSATFEDSSFAGWGDAVTGGTIVYDAGRARDCITDLTAMRCALLNEAPLPDSCIEAAAGQVALGNPCNYDAECQGRDFCDSSSTCPGMCAARLPVNSSCNRNEQCEDNLVCDEDLGQCLAPVTAGSSCGGGGPGARDCTGFAFCVGEDEMNMIPGTCATLQSVFSVTQGNTCDFDTGDLCATGLTCVFTVAGATCEYPDASSGGACNFAFPDECPSGEYCALSGGPTGTCTSLPTDGQNCATLFNLCADGHVCDTNTTTCVSIKRIGQNCTQSLECASEFCNTTCEMPACSQ